MKSKKLSTGFTLVELILYVALISLVFGSLTTVGLVTIGEGQKSSVIQEVGATGRYISERIKKEIREAKGINSISSTSISLQSFISASDPTIIDLSSGNIRIKQGAASAVVINPTGTSITALVFTNNSSTDAKTKNVSFVFSVQSATTSANQRYINNLTLRGSGEIRSN